LVYAYDSNFLCKNTNIKKSTAAILVTSNEDCIALNAEKTKCMVMSCEEQNAGHIHNTKAVIKSFLQQSSNT